MQYRKYAGRPDGDLAAPFSIITPSNFLFDLTFCSVTAIGAVITQNWQLRTLHTDAVESHMGCGRAGSSIGLEQGRKFGH